jgi:hypothetical protein
MVGTALEELLECGLHEGFDRAGLEAKSGLEFIESGDEADTICEVVEVLDLFVAEQQGITFIGVAFLSDEFREQVDERGERGSQVMAELADELVFLAEEGLDIGGAVGDALFEVFIKVGELVLEGDDSFSGLEAGSEFVGVVGFGDIVIGAGVESAD